MMQASINELIVTDIAGNFARLICENTNTFSVLESMGFSQEDKHFVRSIKDDADRLQLVLALIDMNALFSSGRDWSPAELVELYRDEGRVTKNFRIITWTAPGDFLITTR